MAQEPWDSDDDGSYGYSEEDSDESEEDSDDDYIESNLLLPHWKNSCERLHWCCLFEDYYRARLTE